MTVIRVVSAGLLGAAGRRSGTLWFAWLRLGVEREKWVFFFLLCECVSVCVCVCVLSFIITAHISIEVRKRRELCKHAMAGNKTLSAEGRGHGRPWMESVVIFTRNFQKKKKRDKGQLKATIALKSPPWRHHEYSNEFSFIGVVAAWRYPGRRPLNIIG